MPRTDPACPSPESGPVDVCAARPPIHVGRCFRPTRRAHRCFAASEADCRAGSSPKPWAISCIESPRRIPRSLTTDHCNRGTTRARRARNEMRDAARFSAAPSIPSAASSALTRRPEFVDCGFRCVIVLVFWVAVADRAVRIGLARPCRHRPGALSLVRHVVAPRARLPFSARGVPLAPPFSLPLALMVRPSAWAIKACLCTFVRNIASSGIDLLG